MAALSLGVCWTGADSRSFSVGVSPLHGPYDPALPRMELRLHPDASPEMRGCGRTTQNDHRHGKQCHAWTFCFSSAHEHCFSVFFSLLAWPSSFAWQLGWSPAAEQPSSSFKCKFYFLYLAANDLSFPETLSYLCHLCFLYDGFFLS